MRLLHDYVKSVPGPGAEAEKICVMCQHIFPALLLLEISVPNSPHF